MIKSKLKSLSGKELEKLAKSNTSNIKLLSDILEILSDSKIEEAPKIAKSLLSHIHRDVRENALMTLAYFFEGPPPEDILILIIQMQKTDPSSDIKEAVSLLLKDWKCSQA